MNAFRLRLPRRQHGESLPRSRMIAIVGLYLFHRCNLILLRICNANSTSGWFRWPEYRDTGFTKNQNQYEDASVLVPLSTSRLVIMALLIKSVFTPAYAVPIHVCFYNYSGPTAHWSLRFPTGIIRSFSVEPGGQQRHKGDSVGTVCVGDEPYNFPACPNSRSQNDFRCD
jgi:hypothetical protein